MNVTLNPINLILVCKSCHDRIHSTLAGSSVSFDNEGNVVSIPDAVMERIEEIRERNRSKHNDSDEWYTLPALVEVVQPFIKPNQVIWCPFDTSESAFVKVLSKTNQVIYSHIKTGQDFFSYEPTTHYDVIVSNPPFSFDYL